LTAEAALRVGYILCSLLVKFSTRLSVNKLRENTEHYVHDLYLTAVVGNLHMLTLTYELALWSVTFSKFF